MAELSPGPGAPTPPIELAGGADAATAHLDATAVDLDDGFLRRLAGACAAVTTEPDALGEASRDWWPLAMIWATEGQVAGRAGAIARPSTAEEVAAVVALCNDAAVPLTATAGRSGVCGASVPVYGGVVLDLCGLSGIRGVDDESLLVDVLAGTFGDAFEDELQSSYDLTAGHWPQSMSLSTVGGWLACRGAGQYSTRYGKIEDIVVGLDVVLADGRQITTGGQPRQAVGPDLTQLLVGSEGTLGVITGARLRAHPKPPHESRAAYGFSSFASGLDTMRRILRRGATPAVLRLYDDVETQRNFDVEGTHALLVLDEGDRALVDATLAVVEDECRLEAEQPLDVTLVERWMGHRNDVAALEALIGKGFVVDTMEVGASWSKMAAIYEAATKAIAAVPGAMAVSAHQSHSYTDGGCLYFTFAGGVEPADRDRFYKAAWDAGTRAVLAGGGALSHHHGIGLNRSRFMRDALGPAFDTLVAVKQALDPKGILNPGKLGLPSPWGDANW